LQYAESARISARCMQQLHRSHTKCRRRDSPGYWGMPGSIWKSEVELQYIGRC